MALRASHEHIGTVPQTGDSESLNSNGHTRRNVVIGVLAITGVGAIAGFEAMQGGKKESHEKSAPADTDNTSANTNDSSEIQPQSPKIKSIDAPQVLKNINALEQTTTEDAYTERPWADSEKFVDASGEEIKYASGVPITNENLSDIKVYGTDLAKGFEFKLNFGLNLKFVQKAIKLNKYNVAQRNTYGNEIGEFDEFIATFNPDINEGFFPRSKAGSAPLVAVDEKQAELDRKFQNHLNVSQTGEPATANTTMYVNVTKDDNNQLLVQELEPIDGARQVLVGLTFRSPTSTGDSISNIITKTLLYPNEAGEFKVGSNFELDLVDFSEPEDS